MRQLVSARPPGPPAARAPLRDYRRDQIVLGTLTPEAPVLDLCDLLQQARDFGRTFRLPSNVAARLYSDNTKIMSYVLLQIAFPEIICAGMEPPHPVQSARLGVTAIRVELRSSPPGVVAWRPAGSIDERLGLAGRAAAAETKAAEVDAAVEALGARGLPGEIVEYIAELL